MNFTTALFLSQIAIFPFLLAIFKSKYSNEINKLNIYFIVSYIIECITALFINLKLYAYSTIIGNIFILISCIILINFFQKKKSNSKYFLIAFITIVWLTDNIIIHELNKTNSFSRIVSNAIIFFLSIRLFNEIIMMRSNKTNIKSLLFFTSGFIIDSIFRINYEAIYYFKKDISIEQDKVIFTVIAFSNAFANIIFTYAYICFKKQKKIQSYIS
jgi:hypothetical protein